MSLASPNALMSMVSQAGPTPGPTAQVAQTDVIGPIMAKWQGELQNAQLKRQAQQALMGSVFGLAGSGLGSWGLQGFPWKGGMVQKGLANLFGSTPTPATPLNLVGDSSLYNLGTAGAGAADMTGGMLGDAAGSAAMAGVGDAALAGATAAAAPELTDLGMLLMLA